MAQFDVNIQIIAAAQYNGMKFYSFGQTRSLGVRGIQKLVNMFAKFLLTPIGSNPLDLSEGTEVTNLLGSNVTPNDAREVLLVAVENAVAAIQANQANGGVPDDEKLSTANVTNFIIIDSGPGFAAQIYIENVVQQGLNLLLPTLQVI